MPPAARRRLAAVGGPGKSFGIPNGICARPASWFATFRVANKPNKPSQQPACQNKKYRCASGSTRAGSQVSSWPSARTA